MVALTFDRCCFASIWSKTCCRRIWDGRRRFVGWRVGCAISNAAEKKWKWYLKDVNLTPPPSFEIASPGADSFTNRRSSLSCVDLRTGCISWCPLGLVFLSKENLFLESYLVLPGSYLVFLASYTKKTQKWNANLQSFDIFKITHSPSGGRFYFCWYFVLYLALPRGGWGTLQFCLFGHVCIFLY